jgi:chromate transporter
VIGFGGPAAHIALLRQLVVERTGWLEAEAFQDALAACNLLPGPASTQLAIFCAYRVAGSAGAVVGGLCFVLPAVVMILALSALFLAHTPPLWVKGAGAGAGAAVAAVALRAGFDLLRTNVASADGRARRFGPRLAFIVIGAVAAALSGPYLVLVLLACGLAGLLLDSHARRSSAGGADEAAAVLPLAAVKGGLGALAWTALKVGALAFGGGFVIVPLMQGDAVHAYHWMTSQEFLRAVALGQVTPGPVVATVAAVGYAAHGLSGGVLAAAMAFAPSFAFVLLGGARFGRLRENERAQAFLSGAGPAAIGAILGAAVPLALALSEPWQAAVLGASAVALLLARRGIVETLLGAAAVGAVAALAGAAAG